MDNSEEENDLHLDVAICPHLPSDYVQVVVDEAAESAASLYSRFGICRGRWRARRLQGACSGPMAFRRDRWGQTRPSYVMVIACDKGLSKRDLERAARKVAKDPLAVSVLRFSLRAFEDPIQQAALTQSLWASVWKAWLYSGARPDNVRTRIDLGQSSTSRRSFLTLSYKDFVPCPVIIHENCASGVGCRICVDHCPADALFVGEQMRIEIDRKACTSCGICVTDCPREAVRMPATSLAELWASLFGASHARHALHANIQDGSFQAQGLLWTCSRADAVDSPWVVARARCVANLPASLILAPLTMGYQRTAVAHCGADCLSGRIEEVRTKVEFARVLLDALGSDPSAVELFTNGKIPQSSTHLMPQSGAGAVYLRKESVSGAPSGDGPSWFLYTECSDRPNPSLSHGASHWYPKASDVILQLQRMLDRSRQSAHGEDRLVISSGLSDSSLSKAIIHDGSPLGIIDVDPEACTLCGTCAKSCPADALVLENGVGEQVDEQTDEIVMLSADYTACVACGNCMSTCPEREAGAIRISRGIDFELLELGRRVVNETRIHRCPRCQNPIASSKVFQRVATILGDEFSGRMLLCEECKGVF
jgi:ferredoxin